LFCSNPENPVNPVYFFWSYRRSSASIGGHKKQ
jgi:hypothetical protein